MPRIPITLFFLLADALFAQEPVENQDPAETLARAQRLEEVDGDHAAALDLYETVLRRKDLSRPLRWRAQLGRVRTLLPLGRLDEARVSLDALEALKETDEDAEQIARLRARIAERQDDGNEDEAFRERITSHLVQREYAQIASLGRPAFDTIRELSKTTFGLEDRVIPATMNLPYEEVPTIVLANFQRLRDREVLGVVQEFVRRLGEGTPQHDWDAVIRFGMNMEDPLVREAMAPALRHLKNPTTADWMGALQDANHEVRRTAFALVADRGDEIEKRAWELALADDHPEVRRAALIRLQNLVTRDPVRARAYARASLEDPDTENRRAAFLHLLYTHRAEEDVVRRGLEDKDEQIVGASLSRLEPFLTANDLPRLFDLMERFRRQEIARLVGGHFDAESLLSAAGSLERVVRWTRSPQPQTRGLALSILARVGDANLVDILVPFLSSSSGDERAAALLYVLRHDVAEAVPKVIENLRHLKVWFPGFAPQNWARKNTPPMGHQGILQWVARSHPEQLPELIRTGALDVPSSTLASTLLDLPESTREPCLEALWSVATGSTLGNHTIQRLLRELEPTKAAIELATKGLGSPEEDLQAGAARYLVAHGDGSQTDALLEALRSESQSAIVPRLVEGFARRARPEHVTLLREEIERSEGQASTRTLIRALLALPFEEADRVIYELAERRGMPRADLFERLGKDGRPAGRELLERELMEGHIDSTEERRAAMKALSRYRSESIIDPLLRTLVLHGEKDGTRTYSLASAIVTDDTPWAIAALHDAGPEIYLQALDRALARADVDENQAAAFARLLAFLPEEESSPDANSSPSGKRMLALLSDPRPTVRSAAIEAAAHVLYVPVIPRLRTLLRDPEGPVSKAADTALLRFRAMGYDVR